MGFRSWASARKLSACALCLSAFWLSAACSGSKQKGPETAADDQTGPPPPCRKNEVREYFCDDLLPFANEKPAPEPYQTCPSNVGVKGNVFPATSTWARFDIPRTDLTRKRTAPGHACCYSWCSTLKIADVDQVDVNSCKQPHAMPERLCISTAEAGVSSAAAAPYEQCAAAIVPPPAVAFSAPKAAGLDLQATAEKRSQGVSECCYGWCSKVPINSAAEGK